MDLDLGNDDLAIIKASGDSAISTSPPVKLNPPVFSSADEEDLHVGVDEVRLGGGDPIEKEGDYVVSDGVTDDAREDLNSERGKEFTRRRESTEDGRIQAAQTQTKRCCDKEGHICFDCFPIPDKLLELLHRQTGMSKLASLQTVQTVVKFYKQDLVCSKYFACEPSDDDDGFSNYTQSEERLDSALLFRATPKPLRRQYAKKDIPMMRSAVREPAPQKHAQVKFKATAFDNGSESEFMSSASNRPTLKLCVADKFRNMVRCLRLESGSWDWNDPKNVSFLFTFFSKLNKVVAKLDAPTLKKLILEDDFDVIWIMAKLLHKEKRWSIEWEILSVLGTIASRDSRSRRRLLDSDFPTFLSRIIRDPKVESAKLGAYAELLAVLFTGGKELPIYLMEHFGLDFVISMLDMIENDESRPGWALPDVLVKVLLAYNLQFDSNDVYSNVSILAISRMGTCKTLTSLLIDWLEQKDAPLTNSWEVSISVHQCVIKMITDIFLCRTTSHVFSVSQCVVVMRLLTWGISNFIAGDKRRTLYLKLIHTILRHCKYDYIRNTPCMDTLEEILCERTELSLHDQVLIRSIFKEFPQIQAERNEF